MASSEQIEIEQLEEECTVDFTRLGTVCWKRMVCALQVNCIETTNHTLPKDCSKSVKSTVEKQSMN